MGCGGSKSAIKKGGANEHALDSTPTKTTADYLDELSPGIIWAALMAAGADPELHKTTTSPEDKLVWFITRRFVNSLAASIREGEAATNDSNYFRFYDGHLFSRVLDPLGMSMGRGLEYEWIRLPSRLFAFETGGGSQYALTFKGLYVWGRNEVGQVGMGDVSMVPLPTHIDIEVPYRVWADGERAFALGTRGLYACGMNFATNDPANGDKLLLAPGADMAIKHFAHVRLPEGQVDSISLKNRGTVIHMGNRALVCGNNSHGRLGVGHNRPLPNLTRLPYTITGMTCDGPFSLILSDGRLKVVGKVKYSPLKNYLVGHRRIYTIPAQVRFPWPVSKFITDGHSMFFVEKADTLSLKPTSEWFALGCNMWGCLGVDKEDDAVSVWSPVGVGGINAIYKDGYSVWLDTESGLFACGDNRGSRLGTEVLEVVEVAEDEDDGTSVTMPLPVVREVDADMLTALTYWELDPTKPEVLGGVEVEDPEVDADQSSDSEEDVI
ncbi:endodeoxyribonuclease RusA family protein [Carpediemonas membranifera]|uniref:Endodeoxyribonuclease RusA family protein n=1 Tax=Carpediemonas membranifera TaxID=201153 RepID=A0A8J6E002_9EUKA|nr:endodeoxyribonuclease RusA family protein [Carpediemonas membranifera]|eukprot:KAG9394359.1 endodeoxyribonuclease RusA family protein [Carpediemonas membranifera]